MSYMSSRLNSRLPVGTVFVRIGQMTPAFELAVQSADQHMRHVVMDVLIGVPHVAAVENQRMIEQRAVAVRGLGKVRDQMGQHLDVILVDLRKLVDVASDLRRDATRRGNPRWALRFRDKCGR